MNDIEPVIGRFAYSKAGRDKGRLFIIIDIIDEDFVLIADGDLRPIERPKKKRIKHMMYTELFDDTIADRIKSGRKPSNAELRGAVSKLQEQLQAFNKEG